MFHCNFTIDFVMAVYLDLDPWFCNVDPMEDLMEPLVELGMQLPDISREEEMLLPSVQDDMSIPSVQQIDVFARTFDEIVRIGGLDFRPSEGMYSTCPISVEEDMNVSVSDEFRPIDEISLEELLLPRDDGITSDEETLNEVSFSEMSLPSIPTEANEKDMVFPTGIIHRSPDDIPVLDQPMEHFEHDYPLGPLELEKFMETHGIRQRSPDADSELEQIAVEKRRKTE
jgi:hypothetical protein